MPREGGASSKSGIAASKSAGSSASRMMTPECRQIYKISTPPFATTRPASSRTTRVAIRFTSWRHG